eukprot:6133261-Amphidinium_carterae.2
MAILPRYDNMETLLATTGSFVTNVLTMSLMAITYEASQGRQSTACGNCCFAEEFGRHCQLAFWSR